MRSAMHEVRRDKRAGMRLLGTVFMRMVRRKGEALQQPEHSAMLNQGEIWEVQQNHEAVRVEETANDRQNRRKAPSRDQGENAPG